MKKFTGYIFIILSMHIFPNLYAQKVTEPKNNPQDWSKPYEPFRIAGNLYYVGTYDLASYLVVTGEGNILINTGLADSYATINKNIEKLGFRYNDIKILLTTQAHFDHLGALAAMKKRNRRPILDRRRGCTGGKEWRIIRLRAEPAWSELCTRLTRQAIEGQRYYCTGRYQNSTIAPSRAYKRLLQLYA